MESNRLIAEFMNVEMEDGLYMFSTPMDDYKTDTLYFDCSWDWLMPVVSKCRDESNAEDNHWEAIYYSLDGCDIDVTYQAVVEFIIKTKNDE